MVDDLKDIFTSKLMVWHRNNARELPWKNTNDPYKIWLSEIILQQTRVDQGLPYYLRFVEKFPTVSELATADEDEVMKLWEGLGYYSRARNLHHTAKVIAFDLKGKFPKKLPGLLNLRGVGEYTAAAIASFAFNLPYAVVDGNVVRVISRYFGIEKPVDISSTKKEIKEAANVLLDIASPADYNQAILDFGASICLPRHPHCQNCPVSETCASYHKGAVNKIPFKSRKINKKERFFHYHIFSDGALTLVRKRVNNDIWKSLYEFYLVEDEMACSLKEIPRDLTPVIIKMNLDYSTGPVMHVLTHQNIKVWFYYYNVVFEEINLISSIDSFYLVENKKLSTFAFPRVIQKHVIGKKVIQ